MIAFAAISAEEDVKLDENLPTRRRSSRDGIGLAGAYDFLPIENPDVKPVFFHPNSPPESQPIRYVSASVPRTFLGAAPVDDLINPERNTRQMAAQLQSAAVPVTVQFYPRTNHVTLIGTFAAPLRFLGPVLDDVVEFVKTAPPR